MGTLTGTLDRNGPPEQARIFTVLAEELAPGAHIRHRAMNGSEPAGLDDAPRDRAAPWPRGAAGYCVRIQPKRALLRPAPASVRCFLSLVKLSFGIRSADTETAESTGVIGVG
jgi:hypothetical protein